MSFIFNFFRKLVDTMLELFSFGRKRISNKLPIFIKTNTGQQLSLNLDPGWNISNVKTISGASVESQSIGSENNFCWQGTGR